jgi:hypothetical protein
MKAPIDELISERDKDLLQILDDKTIKIAESLRCKGAALNEVESNGVLSAHTRREKRETGVL